MKRILEGDAVLQQEHPDWAECHVIDDIIEDRLPPRNATSTPYLECELEFIDDELIDATDDLLICTYRIRLTHRLLDAGTRGAIQSLMRRVIRPLRESLTAHAEDFSWNMVDTVKVGLFHQVSANLEFSIFADKTTLDESTC